MNILVVAAHPDDEMLGLGGTLARHAAAGDRVFPVIASEGATARYSNDQIVYLMDCCKQSCAVLGIEPPDFLKLPDQGLDRLSQLEINRLIEERVQRHEPAVVYIHHHADMNLDHKILHECALVACRPKPGSSVKRVLSFYVPSSTDWAPATSSRAFMPNWFVDITETIDLKLRAAACYESETPPYPHPRSIEALRAQAQFWGTGIGRGYAEPFVMIRNIE